MRTAEITCKQVQKELQPFAQASNPLALTLVAFDLLGYCALFWLTVVAPLYLKPFGAVALAVLISRCFVLGHDACHRSLFTGTWANRVAARLLMLNSHTPCSLWEIGHNTIHHGFTNLKGRDPVWTPLDPAEFRQLSPWQQRWQRLYRTRLGFALYYGTELWWKKLIFPNRQEVAVYRREHSLDNGLVSAAIMTQVAVAQLGSHSVAQFAVNLFFALLLPTFLWWWFMGFAIYVHHTHPSVVWFTDRREWSFAEGQLSGSIHMKMPEWFNRLAHQIFDHTAHHVDIRIPSYRLHAAQRKLEETYPQEVVTEAWSWRRLREILNHCQLYDYRHKRWMRFDEA